MTKKKTYYWWIAAVLVLLVFAFFFFGSKKNESPTYQATFKNLTEAVYASGNVLPKNEYKVYAMADGILAERLVNEGTEVSKNQMLFVVNNQQQSIKLETAQDSYTLAQQNYTAQSPILRELALSIDNARLQMQNDSINYERYKNLWKENATSQIELDRRKLAYQTAQHNYSLQKARYEKTKNDLKLGLQNAQSQVQLNAAQKGEYIIESAIKGRVFEVYKEQGEAVRRGEAIALLGSSETLYLQLEIDELDINKIKHGQEVLVKIDVFKNQVFKAKVAKIYPMLNPQNQSFRVDAEFVGEYPNLYSGLTAEANIIIQEKPKTLVIPKSLLVGEDSLWIVNNEQTQKIKIKKGIENFEWVEVLAGIDSTSKIIKK